MGTASSYGGSGGAWTDAGDDLVDWLDGLPDGPGSLPPAEDSPDPGSDQDSSGDPDHPFIPMTNPVPGLRPVLRGVAQALRGSRGGGGSGAGTGGGSGRSAGARTSRAAGRVGGRAAAGVSALRAGDTAGLLALGLDPAELDALGSDYAKAARIAEAAAEGAPTSIQDEELRQAAAATAIWGLGQIEAPTPLDLVKRFVEEYLYRVVTVELGVRLRDGTTGGDASVPTEQTLRSTIRAMIRHVPVADAGTGAVDMGNAIEATYARILDIWAADE